MNTDKISIVKSSGEVVQFSLTKLKKSLKRTGADDEVVASILETVHDELYEGITTKEIYNRAFALLKKKKNMLIM